VYWKPPWAILEDEFECLLVNARHVKQVPGRKTDVADAAWLCQLLEAGLLRASFVPPKPIRTDILGASGRAMLDALVAGTTDPAVLADLAKGKLRKKLPALREALEGRFDQEHGIVVSAILAHIDFLDEQISLLSDAIEEQIRPFAPAVELLCTIPGVQRRTAEVIVAEIGADMSVCPTAGHLASWAGLCPGNDESAGKRRSGRSRKGSRWLSIALTEAAQANTRSRDTYLSAQYRRLKPRRGHRKAIGAIRHSIIVASWHMLTTGEIYRDTGSDYFTRLDPDKQTRRLVAQLERLGHIVTLQEAAA
jgi:transposase